MENVEIFVSTYNLHDMVVHLALPDKKRPSAFAPLATPGTAVSVSLC